VRTNLRALETERGIGEASNIGTEHSTSINQLYAVLAESLHRSEISPVYTA
jgi:nucleoside-diphosphate-sugar epimerase